MREPGLQEGTYFLRLAASPSPLVGVDPGSPLVVTGGEENLWIVRKVGDGKYTLMVMGDRSSFVGMRGNLVGVEPTPTIWFIPGPEGGPYTIQKYKPTVPGVGWTVMNPSEPGSPVALGILPEVGPTPENQKWYFVRPEDN